MVGGAGRDGRQSHPRHACFRNHLAGGGAGSSSSGALCSRRTNARTCHHRRDRSRIPLALGVFALGPPRHLAPGVASNTIHAAMASSYASGLCWSPPSGGGFGLLSRGGQRAHGRYVSRQVSLRPCAGASGRQMAPSPPPAAAVHAAAFDRATGPAGCSRCRRCRGAGVRSIWRASNSARHAIFCRSRS